MANVILVTSGKGGVGKSTVACALGLAFAAKGSKTVLVELDVGLRGLDLMLGVEDRTVYDLGNILRGECRLSDGFTPVTEDGNLSLVAAPAAVSARIDYDDVASFCRTLALHFENVIIDAPAGIGVSVLLAPRASDLVLIVATPDMVSARDAGRLNEMLNRHGADRTRLVINKVSHKRVRGNELRDLDEVIDLVGSQLIGVVPFDEALSPVRFGKGGLGGVCAEVFSRIASRVSGEYEPLLIQ